MLAVFARWLGGLADASLQLDAPAAARLTALSGSALVVRAEGPGGLNAEFALVVDDGHVELSTTIPDQPQAIIAGSIADLASWALTRDHRLPAGLRIDGDPRLPEALADIARTWRPDLARPLGQLFGNRVAEQLVNAAELAGAGARALMETAGREARQSAGRWFANDATATTFLDELDDLRLAVDRLAARVGLAEQRGSTAPATDGQP